MLLVLALLSGCVPWGPAALPPPEPDLPYAEILERIDEERQIAPDPSAAFDTSIARLIDAWYGTPWDFDGTASTPGADPIACGHFVAGILSDAGLRVDRLHLGQQASEHIITTVASEASIRRYRDAPVDRVLGDVEADGHGIYVVGLDTHVGFLVHLPERPQAFCHSSARGRRGVVCEVPRHARALRSRYTVVGRLGDASLIRAWRGGHRVVSP